MPDVNPADRELKLKRSHFRRLLKQEPCDGELWLEYARFLHTELNHPRAAVAALTRAERFFPEIDLGLRIGDALSRCGEVKKGLRRMYQFLKSNPTPFGYRVLARHLISAGKYRKARKLLRRALLIEPQSAETHALLGEVSYENSKRGAISFYRKALELDPACQEAWGSLGFALIQNPTTRREGLDALEKAINLEPSDVLSHLSAGLGYSLSNDLARAEYHYNKAVELRPTDRQARAYYEQFRRRRSKELCGGNGASPITDA